MNRTDMHIHCCFCDGTGHPEEYVKTAIEKGFSLLGFSSHAPLPFPTDWTMPPHCMMEYCRTIHKLKQEYKDQIDICLGMEMDYIPGILHPTKQLGVLYKNTSAHPDLPSLDYVIGSVHFLGQLFDGTHWTVDGSLDELKNGIRCTFGGSIRKAVETYYRRICEMVSCGGMDVIGHLDLIKKFNKESAFFSEEDIWYRNAVLETLQVISASGIILEINTGGMSRGYTDAPYPSPWILEHCSSLSIPVTLHSDAHHPQFIGYEFEHMERLLYHTGYREIYMPEPRGWIPHHLG